MDTFKVGDKVKCIEPSSLHPDDYGHVGKEYEVSMDQKGGGSLFLKGLPYGCTASRFELVKSEHPFKVGDIVECVDANLFGGRADLQNGKFYTVTGHARGELPTRDIFVNDGVMSASIRRFKLGHRPSPLDGAAPRYLVDQKTGTMEPLDIPVRATQVGGNHYTAMGIQPFEYALANNLGALEHTAIKYLSRWKQKGGVEDLKKAVHAINFLIEHTEKNGEPVSA